VSYLEFDCSFQYPTGFGFQKTLHLDKQVTALVGPSGCGKTTLLNLISGMVVPTRGQITLGGKQLFDSSKRIFVRPEQRGVGYVFQDYQLFPHMTVWQNMRYGLLRNTKSPYSLDKVAGVLQLNAIASRYPESLSGGEKQRVALGRAILGGPGLLLMDEPFSAIGVAHRQEVTQFIRQSLLEFQIPAILVSHDLACIEEIATEVIAMD
jgi:molybdate transport system ATP-binding protein